MLRPFRRLRLGSVPTDALAAAVDRIQDFIEEAFGQLSNTNKAGLDTVLLEGVSISSPSTIITHGLRRQPKGWRIVDASDSTALAIYRTAWDGNTITLASPDVTTISLEVF